MGQERLCVTGQSVRAALRVGKRSRGAGVRALVAQHPCVGPDFVERRGEAMPCPLKEEACNVEEQRAVLMFRQRFRLGGNSPYQIQSSQTVGEDANAGCPGQGGLRPESGREC